MGNCKIIAAASSLPDRVVTNGELAGFLDTSDEWIISRTGIRERRVSEGGGLAGLCSGVFKGLMERSGMSPLDIDLIIVATFTPDYTMPSTACLVQGECGADNAFCFDISAACSGFVFALSTAHKFLSSGDYRNAVVIGGEICSRVLDWEDRSTCVLFGDGAGGVLLTASVEPGILAEDLRSDGRRARVLTAGHMPVKSPFAKDGEVGEVGEVAFIRMNGRQVYDFAVREVPSSIERLMDRAGRRKDELKYVIPHQANGRFAEAFAKKLSLPVDRFYINIGRYGNTSAASIPIAMAELVDSGALCPGRGDLVALAGFGGGLTWGSMLLRI